MTVGYSVVIPAYNAAETIGQAIQSVLDQTVPAQEIIVVDDGSTDATASVAAGMAGPITVIRQENRGNRDFFRLSPGTPRRLATLLQC